MLGVIGVGAIGAAIVSGLSAGSEPPEILLSPRSADVVAKLAAAYPNVRVAASNQAVVEQSSTVLLCVRPVDASSVMSELQLREHQSLISVLAGVSVARLRELAVPVHDIARAIPLPSVAARRGITPLYPVTASARSLFEQLGGVIEVTEETSFELFSASTATIAAHFLYLDRISSWLAAQGIAPAAARQYVAAMFGQLAASLHDSDLDFREQMREHTTPGGINELFCEVVTDEGVWDAVSVGLDRVRQRLMDREKGSR